MKQHITEKQFNELGNKGESTLFRWGKKRGLPSKPLLSMGQMLEFLDEKKKWKMFMSINHFTGSNCWGIMDGLNQGRPVLYSSKELCDALWEAVKEILEK